MKKKILCIVLAVVLVLSAVGLGLYTRLSSSYDYSKKDASKYLPLLTSADVVKAFYDGDVVLEIADEEGIQYYIADQFKAATEKEEVVYEGTFGLYDLLKCSYYLTVDVEGETVVISDMKHINPKNPVTVQLGADDDLSRIIDALKGTSAKDTSFVTFTSGELYDGDILYVSYTVKKGDSVEETKTYQRYDMADANYLDGICDGLTAKFEAARADTTGITIGKARDFTLGDKTVTVTVTFAARDIIGEGGEVVAGDHVYFTYKEGTGTAEQYHGVLGTDNAKIDKEILGEGKTGFAQQLSGLKIGKTDEPQKITVGTGEDAKTFTVEVEYVLPADPTATTRAGFEAAEKFATTTYTFDADSEAESEIKMDDGKTMALAGKTVTCHVAVGSFIDVELAYDDIVDLLKYTAEGSEEKLDEYVAAYITWKAADKAKTDAQTAYDEGAAKTGDKALTKAELKELEDKLTKAKEAETKAKEALTKAETAYVETLEEGATANIDEAIVESYTAYAEKQVQNELNNEYSWAVGKIVWENMLEAVKADEGTKLPSRAVHVAYRGLIDELKAEYYGSSTNQEKYKNFRSFVKQYKYKDQDWKAAVKAEAEQVVLETLVAYRLVEIYDPELTENQQYWVDLYQNYGSAEYAEQYRIGALFDNAMQEVANAINPDLVED